MSMLSPEALTRDGSDPRWSSARSLVFIAPPATPPNRALPAASAVIDFQSGDLLARSRGSDLPPLRSSWSGGQGGSCSL